MDSKTRRIYKFVFVTLFVDLLAFTLILPLLPKILDYYSVNDKSGAYSLFNNNVRVIQNLLRVPESHNKVLLAGLLGSWFSLLQFISSPVLGAVSDRYGRKPILLMALSGSLVSYAIWFTATESFALFILSRTVGGLCKANVGLSLAVVSDVSNESTRGKGMAMVGSSFSLAFIFGPLLGAYLSTLAKGVQLQDQLILNPSAIAILLSIVDLALVALFLDETNQKQSQPTHNLSKKKSQKQSDSTLTNALHYVNPKSLFSFQLVKEQTKEDKAVLIKAGYIYFFYLLFYSGLEFTLSFLTHIRFGFTSVEQGKLYLYSGLIMAAIQGGYIRRMKGGKEALMAYAGLALIVPSFIIMGLSTSVSHIYASLTLYAFSSAIVVPCLTTVVSSHSPLNSRGVTMGTFRSIGALARALGPCIASLLFWTFGSTLCYITGALALLIPFHMMKGLYDKLKQPSLPTKNNAISPKELAKAC